MRLILGPFHPELEDGLVQEIRTARKGDLLSPMMVVVPSDSLRRRIKILLTREQNLSLLNLHILTFHGLSRSLFEERHGGMKA